MTCTALTIPLNPRNGRKIRRCGLRATFLVGPDRLPRCGRHAVVARRRGEAVVPAAEREGKEGAEP